MAEQSLAQNQVSKDPSSLPKKILVAVDGSDESLAAARFAIELAGNFRAELSTLHVILIPEYVSEEVRNRLKQDLGSRGELALKKVRESIQGKEIQSREMLLFTTKSVVTTICEFAADDGAGLIIIGASGAGGVAKVVLGTVAVGVAREARCPVLLVR